MGSGKFYFYNPETIKFEKLSFTTRYKLWRAVPFILFTFVLSVSIFTLINLYLPSPKLKKFSDLYNGEVLKLSMLKNNISRLEEMVSTIEYNDDNIFRTYFEVEPIPSTTRNAGFGGHDYLEKFIKYDQFELLSEIAVDLEILATKTVVQSRSYDDIIEMAKNKEKRLAARPAIQPISIKELTHFGSPFGIRIHPILKERKMHEGIDLTAPLGTKIFATADGVIVEAQFTGGGYGNKVVIDHGYGYCTLYGHLHKIHVESGQRVKRGDFIGTVGSTGLSVAPHLHYEVHVNGRKVNPLNYYANDISAAEYDRMINLLSNADPGFDIN